MIRKYLHKKLYKLLNLDKKWIIYVKITRIIWYASISQSTNIYSLYKITLLTNIPIDSLLLAILGLRGQ